MRRAAALVLGGLLALTFATSSAAAPRPNIVLVVTDDQTLASLNAATMPNVVGSIGAGGTEFTEAIATTPLCCPSRGSMLTGQYAHNHGTLANTPGYEALRDKRNTLPVWLDRAGYVTAHVGKYLNRYKAFIGDPGEVAPGWDEWRTVLDPARKYVRYYDYRLAVNGEVERIGHRPRDYITRVINRNAAKMVRKYVPGRKPLYLQVDQRAPHVEAGTNSGGPCGGLVPPDPRDATAFQSEPLPRPPSFDEPDVSDKPSSVRNLPPLDDAGEARIALRYRCFLASLRGVDRGVGGIVDRLRDAGELDETALIFTSDNGFFFGEHRIPEQKTRPYEEALRVPLMMKLPGAAPGTVAPTVTEPVANIDLAPTILDLARARPCRKRDDCRTMDGRSLVPLARGEGGWPADRALGIEFDAGERARRTLVCAYTGVRVGGQSFVHYTSAADELTGTCGPVDESERYDLGADPFQLDNLFPAAPGSAAAATEAELQARAAKIHRCAGIEGRDEPTAGRPFCE